MNVLLPDTHYKGFTMRSTLNIIVTFAVALLFSGVAHAALPDYRPAAQVSGTVNVAGSTEGGLLAGQWARAFAEVQPKVKVNVGGRSSAQAAQALAAGSAHIAAMSRRMTAAEQAACARKLGGKPAELIVAIDALAVFVHRTNPIKGMSLKQVDAMFSSTRKRGGSAVGNWGDVGLAGTWAGKAIEPMLGLSPQTDAGAEFQNQALRGGSFKSSVKLKPGASGVTAGIAAYSAGVGFAGQTYRSRMVRPVPLANNGGSFVELNQKNCATGRYPLTRYQYFYIAGSADAAAKELVRFVLSRQGQQIAEKQGHFPLSDALARQQLSKLR